MSGRRLRARVDEEKATKWHLGESAFAQPPHAIGRDTKDDELVHPEAFRCDRHSTRLRSSLVMETHLNPHLDRSTASQRRHSDASPSKAATQFASTPSPKRVPAPDVAPPKVSEFCDVYHSIYIATQPTGWKALPGRVKSAVLLTLVGLITGSASLFIDYWLAKISVYHSYLSDLGFPYFLASALLAVSLSVATTYLFCPQAAGSGVSFMKSAISGVDMSDYLSLRCVLNKLVGMVADFGAGLSVGKEGPFIVISCGVASLLMNTPLFESINHDHHKRLEMLACASAAGVVAAFGAPFAGVLFGVEVTAHFYMVNTLPRSFFAAVLVALLVGFVTQNSSNPEYGSFNLGLSDAGGLHVFFVQDVAMFVLIGVACGLAGALFNSLIAVLVARRDAFYVSPTRTAAAGPETKWQRFWNGLGKRLLVVGVVTTMSCIIEFYGNRVWFAQKGSSRSALSMLFTRDPELPANATTNEGDSGLLSRSLALFLPLKYLITLLSVVLPIPSGGLFAPTFVIGGIFGRLVGELVTHYDLMRTLYEPYEFAIVGAGAFASGVTQAVSTAVLIMELSRSDALNVPVCVAILAAYFTAQCFTENVYDLLISTARLPRLNKLPRAVHDIPSWEVMRDVQEMHVLTADSTYTDAVRVLKACQSSAYAIVDSSTNLYLLATVTRKNLERAIRCRQELFNESMVGTGVSNAIDSCLQVGPARAVKNPLKRARSLNTSYGATPTTADASTSTDWMDWPIHFAFRRAGKIMDWGTNELCMHTKMAVLVNPSPLQLMEMTPMKRVDLLFRMLKINNAYITRAGHLVGVITRDRLIAFLGDSGAHEASAVYTALTNSCFGTQPSKGDYATLA